ncbi:MAG: tRNA dihydrouridine synthase DusB [Oscillospiraceae bacterium]|nr:tRNA dihydrouridine synthase DusB [Oscillospiraceae bacterium]
MQIGSIQVNSKLALAPMAGVSDLAFRTICRELGCGLLYTEMVSAKALVYKDKKTHALLRIGEDRGEGGTPVAVQIFGSDPVAMGEGSALAMEISGADFIDINSGCPVGKIVKGGDGSALMKDPDKAQKVIEAVVRSVSCPVTVKIRKGWDKGHINAVEYAQMCQEAGVSAITVHGRTRVQMYAGKADWDIIREVKKIVKVPVIANGDVFTAQDAAKILRHTGCDAVMIARGSFGNPWIFQQAGACLAGEEIPPLPPIKKRAQTAMRQFELAAVHKGEHIACLEARKHYSWYLKGVPHAGYFKEQIIKAATLDDLRKITEGIGRELKDAPRDPQGKHW